MSAPVVVKPERCPYRHETDFSAVGALCTLSLHGGSIFIQPCASLPLTFLLLNYTLAMRMAFSTKSILLPITVMLCTFVGIVTSEEASPHPVMSAYTSRNATKTLKIPCLNELNAVLDTCNELNPRSRQFEQQQLLPRQNNELLLTLLLFWHNNHRDDDQLSPEQLTASCRAYLGENGAQAIGGNIGGLAAGGVLGFLGSQLLQSRTTCPVCTCSASISTVTSTPASCTGVQIGVCTGACAAACGQCLIPSLSCQAATTGTGR